MHIGWTHNSTSRPVTSTQYGGVALFSIGNAAHRVIEKGSDNSKLGRWNWTRYRKKNQTSWIMMAYHPNLPKGPSTVYPQQNAYFHSIVFPKCPRKAFLQDLCQELTIFLDAWDHIILLLDDNSNTKQSHLKASLELCTLHKVILAKHGRQGLSTFRQNNTRNPIDGIRASPNIMIQAGGYFTYDSVFMKTDHRCLWIDISYTTAFWHNMPSVFKPSVRRLHCKDPRPIVNYVCTYRDFIAKHRLSS